MPLMTNCDVAIAGAGQRVWCIYSIKSRVLIGFVDPIEKALLKIVSLVINLLMNVPALAVLSVNFQNILRRCDPFILRCLN